MSDLDGGNKRALLTADSESGERFVVMWEMFYDGRAIFYTVSQSNGEDAATYIFRKTDVTTGETSELHQWSGDGDWRYFEAAPVGDSVIIQEVRGDYGNTVSRYTAINVKSGSVSEFDISGVIMEGEGLNIAAVGRDGSCVVYDSQIGYTKLYRCNVLTGERTLVFECPDEWTSAEGVPQWQCVPWGERLVIYRFDPERASEFDMRTPDRYVLDEATGELEPLTLTYFSPGYEAPITICAETDDSFLVISDEELVRYTRYGVDGSLYESEESLPLYSMISKEDYWSNNLNYRDITEAQ